MRTDYKDYVPSTELREYNMKNNSNGTVSLEDVTVYQTVGDKLTAGILNELSQNANWPMTHAKTGTTHLLTGASAQNASIFSCVFQATANYTKDDEIQVDGASYTIVMQDGSEPSDMLFANGATVACVINTNARTVNFKSSGGSVKYATGTVTISEYSADDLVVSGLTFEPKVFLAKYAAELKAEGISGLSWPGLDSHACYSYKKWNSDDELVSGTNRFKQTLTYLTYTYSNGTVTIAQDFEEAGFKRGNYIWEAYG